MQDLAPDLPQNTNDFDAVQKEYVIKSFATERPWINYISNNRYTVLLSQTGGGYSFWKDPKSCRITKYRYDNHPQDRPGRYLYFRDADTGQVWSPGWQPVMVSPDQWECRHGLGYSKITSTTYNIEASTTIFVPNDDDCEVWVSRVTNHDTKSRTIKITPYVEFALFNAMDEYSAYFNLHFFNDAKFDPDLNTLWYYMHHHSWMELGKVFMATSEKITGYTVDRRQFIGNYRSESNPEVIETGIDHNTPVLGLDCVGAPSFELTLAPGESREFYVVLGVDNNVPDRAKHMITKYTDPAIVKIELANVKSKWENWLSNLQVDVPDLDTTTMINVWNQYQAKVAFDWSRWASYYHTGTYRGIGFRDTNQDCLGMLHIMPTAVRDKIKLLAGQMFTDGHSHHCFFFDGSGDTMKYGDDHLWINLTVHRYICETGDLSILDEVARYVDGGEGTIHDHCRRALEYAFRESGPHGLPKMFFADWNDCLNNICLKEKGERGESVMVAQQLVMFGNMFCEFSKWSGKYDDSVVDLQSRLNSLKARINEVAWDGNWYTRAYTDDNRTIGGVESGEGQLFLNTQSWAVLSEVANETRGKTAMNSVYDRLNTPVGIKLLDPPYRSFPNDVGSVIHYPEGIKENAGIFCHANTWAIIAETMLGRADRAMQYYLQILPPKVAKTIGFDRYRVEPYVYCQFIAGPDHPNHGYASHSWLTGTSVWSLVAFTQHILGVRPTFDGLQIDPCVPGTWKSFSMNRRFRNADYAITFHNPTGVSTGIKSIVVDGTPINGTIIPVQPAGTSVQVVVTMGA